MPAPAPACPTCAAPLAGPYCAQCGQRLRTARLTLAGVARQAVQHVTSLDRGMGRTALDLIRRPAGLVQDYWRGQTVTYAGPVRFFLVLVTLVQIAAFALGAAPEWADAFAEGYNEAGRTGAEVLDASAAAEAMQRFWVLVFVAFVPVVTLLSRVVFRRAGRTLAEHAVAQLYFLGQVVVGFGLSLIVGDWLYGVWPPLGYGFQVATALGALGLYAYSLGRAFGARRWTGLAGGLAVVVLGMLLYLVGVAMVIGMASAA